MHFVAEYSTDYFGAIGVTSIMIARGAEANPSCFQSSGKLLDPIEEVIPRYARVALFTANHFPNAKYCINAMDLSATWKPPEPGIKAKRQDIRTTLSRLKGYEGLCELFGVDYEKAKEEDLADILPGLSERLQAENREIERETQEDLTQ